MGTAVERCSGGKLSGLRLYFMGAFEDFAHIFLTCSEKIIKILKLGKIFRFVTSFYQYFFVSDKSWYHKTDSGNSYNYYYNSLTMISMKVDFNGAFYSSS